MNKRVGVRPKARFRVRMKFMVTVRVNFTGLWSVKVRATLQVHSDDYILVTVATCVEVGVLASGVVLVVAGIIHIAT